jgi:hypothetical protein
MSGGASDTVRMPGDGPALAYWFLMFQGISKPNFQR